MVKRVTYRGVGLFANGQQVNRATAFGSSGSLNREEIRELGNKGVVEIVDDFNDISLTIDTNEAGNIDLLKALAGEEKGSTKKEIDFSRDFEFSKVDIWNIIRDTTDNNIYTEFIKDAYLSGYSFNGTVDGNATESYSLVSNSKTWFLGDQVHIIRNKLTYAEVDQSWGPDISLSYDIKKVLSVVHNGRVLDSSEYTATVTAGDASIKIDGSTADDDVYATFAGTATLESLEQVGFTPQGVDVAGSAKRRGHIEVYLAKGQNINSGETFIDTLNVDEDMLFRVQSVSVDATLNREDIPQLGNTHYYDRPLQLPIDVSVSFDLIFSELKAFAKFCGKDDMTGVNELNLDNFKNDIGMVIRIYNERDVDDIDNSRKVVKEIHVPYLIPTDEAFNISLDGQATQTFSFRSGELGIKEKV